MDAPNPNQRIFLIDGNSVAFKTLNYWNGPCDGRNVTASMAFMDDNPGLAMHSISSNIVSPGDPTNPWRPSWPWSYEYTISGIPRIDPNRGSGYYLSRVDVCVPYKASQGWPDAYVQEWIDAGLVYVGETGTQCVCVPYKNGTILHYSELALGELLWASRNHPVGNWFWWCVISQPPRVFPYQVISAYRGYPFQTFVNLESPLQRIPEKVTAANLPSGVKFEYNERPPFGFFNESPTFARTYGIYRPIIVYPELSGIINQNGTYFIQINATNPLGTSTATVTIQVVDPPTNFLAVGGAGASAYYAGENSVDALYLGDSKVFP